MTNQNQYRDYMKRASDIMKESDKCVWKGIAKRQPEGRLHRCHTDCNGNNYNCGYYISKREVRR